jgi:hypothetical protein
MPTQTETIANKIAEIYLRHGHDTPDAKTAMDLLLMEYGPAAVEQAGQYVLTRIRG